MASRVCSNCGRTRPHHAKGMCDSCYSTHRRATLNGGPSRLPPGWDTTRKTPAVIARNYRKEITLQPVSAEQEAAAYRYLKRRAATDLAEALGLEPQATG